VTGVVSVVAVTARGEIVLVEQRRAAVGRRVLELPSGLAGDGGREGLARAARRELLEETGYRARRLVRLGELAASAGIVAEVVTLFRATGLVKAGRGGGDATERITVHRVPLAGAAAWIARRGGLVDPKVYAGLHFAGRI
jgi:ADP-ribose pyrophosphatase